MLHLMAGTQFTCFTGTKVQTLTHKSAEFMLDESVDGQPPLSVRAQAGV
jgi:hypothetical protein